MVDPRTVAVKLTVTPPDVPLRPRAKINSSAQRRTAPPRSSPTTTTRSNPVRIKAKVTARAPPPPPRSPPTSTLSVRSHNEHRSIERPRSTEHLREHPRPTEHPPTEHSRPTDSDPPTDDDDDHSTQTLEAAAKSNRKIADLEITNRSLLAINSSLETTKHKQSMEIRDLRRKLRESRLILPPRAFRAVNASDRDRDLASPCSDYDDDDDEEEDESKDQVYVRIKAMLENLLDTGRRALQSTPGDFVQGCKGVAKVLSADEVRSWNDGDADPNNNQEEAPDFTAPDDELDSEDEVERTLVHSYTPSPPPIRISVSKPKG